MIVDSLKQKPLLMKESERGHRTSDSLLIALSAIGLRQSSPTVCKKYTKISQKGAAFSPLAAIFAAKYITIKPLAMIIRPIAHLTP